MAGMTREAHIQKPTMLAFLFCVEGKNKGKPFPWILPKETLGKDNDYKSSAKVID